MENSKEFKWTNLSYLNEIADDDQNFVKEMIQDYLEKIPKSFNELRHAFQDNDDEKVSFISHKLKSSFDFVCAVRLSEMANVLEKIDMKENRTVAEETLSEMNRVLEAVIQELHVHLNSIE